MSLSPTEPADILASKWIIDCFDIRLTQQTECSPRIYCGSGSIFQNKEGELRLKLYHTYQSRKAQLDEIDHAFVGPKFTPGQIIEDHHYFSLEARDMAGRLWTEKNVWVEGKIDIGAVGRVIEIGLRKVTAQCARHEAENKTVGHFLAFVHGNFKLPFNEIEKTATSSALSICRLNVLGVACLLTQRSDHVQVATNVPEGMEAEEFSNRLLEALSIGVGRYIDPQIRAIVEGDVRFICVRSRKASDDLRKLLTPFPSENPHDSKSLNDFVASYIAKISEPLSDMFGFWFRILGEAGGQLENEALVLTSCIEGVLKAYYPLVGKPDAEFLFQVETSRETLKSVELGSRVRERIEASLGSAKFGAPKGALYTLAHNGVISEALVKLWIKLRNKAAHADQLRRTEEELQGFLDEVHGCMELFYALLLHHVGYVGKYCQYSIREWPEGIRQLGQPMRLQDK